MSDIPSPFEGEIPVWLEPIEDELTTEEIKSATASFHPLSDPQYTREVFEWYKKQVVKLKLCSKERAGVYVSRTFSSRFASLYESSFESLYPKHEEQTIDSMTEVRNLVKLRPKQEEEY